MRILSTDSSADSMPDHAPQFPPMQQYAPSWGTTTVLSPPATVFCSGTPPIFGTTMSPTLVYGTPIATPVRTPHGGLITVIHTPSPSPYAYSPMHSPQQSPYASPSHSPQQSRAPSPSPLDSEGMCDSGSLSRRSSFEFAGPSLNVPAHMTPSPRRNSVGDLMSPKLNVPMYDYPMARRGSFGLLSVPGSPGASPQIGSAIPPPGFLPMQQVQAYLQPTSAHLSQQMMQPTYTSPV